MDLLAVRQRAVASNIANADTPGYKTVDIDFANELASALQSGQPALAEVRGLQVKNDGNNVNLDREAQLLAENGMRFQIASQLMRDELRTMRIAIQEGRES